MQNFEEYFDPFNDTHYNEYMRFKESGKHPDFGYGAMGWLPQDWATIAEAKIAHAFAYLLYESRQKNEKNPENQLDLPKQMWYDIAMLIDQGLEHNPLSMTVESAYRGVLISAIKLKLFLTEIKSVMKLESNK
jgi:hypothetical protein